MFFEHLTYSELLRSDIIFFPFHVPYSNILLIFKGSYCVLFQVLPYDVLMQQLDVANVRELEDFLINECMYVVGILPPPYLYITTCYYEINSKASKSKWAFLNFAPILNVPKLSNC